MQVIECKKTHIYFIILGAYIGLLLGLTLCREPLDEASIIVSFLSYSKAFSGSTSAIKGIIANIILFIPAGYFIKSITKKNVVFTVLLGFSVSFSIELIQLITRLGCFDIADLIDNTFGAFLGYFVYKIIPIAVNINIKREIVWIVLAAVIAVFAVIFSTRIIEHREYQERISFAALGDNGNQKNLLILDCEDLISYNNDISLTYQDDGYIRLNGVSDEDTWIILGEVTLEPGTYVFSGLSNVETKTAALLLQCYDESKGDYVDLTPRIGVEPSAEFTLSETTTIKAYAIVYKNYNCDILARPVIYKK